jgi:hypothetical protein
MLRQSPPPALINADLFCAAPDNVLLLLGLLRPEPEGVDDFYARYGAMQAMSALLAACPDKLQVSVNQHHQYRIRMRAVQPTECSGPLEVAALIVTRVLLLRHHSVCACRLACCPAP